MENDRRFALLIDADNISPKYIDIILTETVNYGIASVRRIYGDWTNNSKQSWKDCLLRNSLTPVQQYSYTTGKNSSDSAMIIDAMDILYGNHVDGFIIATSDSDFTTLARRLREDGKMVIGMGESKTPMAFIKACEQFKTLDVLYESYKGERDLEESAAAMEFGTKCSSFAASCTFFFVASLTPGYPFNTFDTVEIATPACFATSLIETISAPVFII